MRFDRVIVVDWSGRAAPSPRRESKDAIWIGQCDSAGESQSYHRTRTEAEAFLHAQLAEGGRQLVGFDFPMGYPSGFAERLTGTASARALHGWLARRINDGPDNLNNRFEIAAAINQALGGAGPFWGCPKGRPRPYLPSLKTVDYIALGLAEKRRVERENPRAKPVWQLLGAGSVGSQALLGIPVVHRLARAFGAAIWPFEPLSALTFAEVYPSDAYAARLWAALDTETGPDALLTRAESDLMAIEEQLAEVTDRLAPLLAVPPEAAEEGWILGAGQADLLAGALR